MSITSSVAGEAARAAPPVAVAVAAVAVAEGITINHVVGVATLVYIGLQAVYLIWRWRREARGGDVTQGPTCSPGEGAQ